MYVDQAKEKEKRNIKYIKNIYIFFSSSFLSTFNSHVPYFSFFFLSPSWLKANCCHEDIDHFHGSNLFDGTYHCLALNLNLILILILTMILAWKRSAFFSV